MIFIKLFIILNLSISLYEYLIDFIPYIRQGERTYFIPDTNNPDTIGSQQTEKINKFEATARLALRFIFRHTSEIVLLIII